MFVKGISDELQKGRRALDSIKEVSIVTDWQWDDYSEKWYLEVIIYNDSIENEEELVPVKSLWYVVVDGSYPKGKIKVYPSVKSGFDDTLYHQSNNGKISENKLWRVGGLCLDSYISALQKLGYKDEPCTVDERLHWHVQRAVNWITCANSRKLINPLDPFELPDFNERGSAILAFNKILENKGY
jgi:hypothetical protein